jgi:hypothetical protein
MEQAMRSLTGSDGIARSREREMTKLLSRTWMDASFGPSSWFEPLKADLRAFTRRELPYWVELDARGSAGGIGGIDTYRFWAVDAQDRLVAGPRIIDEPRHAFALPPGTYRLFLAVADRAGAIDVVSTGVAVRGDIIVLPSGALASTWEALTTITLQASLTMQSLSELAGLHSGVTSNTAMWIQAFGAGAGYGGNSGGHPGAHGLAQCVTSLADYEARWGTYALYYYLGDTGTHKDSGGGDGAAGTVALTSEWATSIDSVVVIAGGAGGGAYDGSNGGDAGIANSAGSASAVTAAGGAGHGSHNGQGGNGSSGGANGMGAKDGNGGVGGYGGKGSAGSRKFTNGTPPGYDGSSGSGGASDGYGGGGGGGYGGGGGGGSETVIVPVGGTGAGVPSPVDCSGGGGGGSYAAGSTRVDSAASSVSTSSVDTGVVRIVFNLDNQNPASL